MTNKSTGVSTVGTVLPRLLAAHGIDTVFGIPGVHTVEMYRGLPDTALRHVHPRHEQGAAFMADGYARATGHPAALFLITGPGVANATAAMGQALQDSIPMLVISSVNDRASLGRGEGRLHEMRDQSRFAAEVALWSRQVLTPDGLGQAIDEAVAAMTCGRPGPVHIEIPIDVFAEPLALDVPARIGRPSAPGASERAVVAAADRLQSARQPLLVLGGGAAHAAEECGALVEALAAPVLVTANAKGILPRGHPLLAGGGLNTKAARKLIRDADVVLAIGTELGETDFEFYGEGPLDVPGMMIRVDIDPRQLSRNAQADLRIVSDARAFVDGLLGHLGGGAAEHAVSVARASKTRSAAVAELEPRFARHLPLADIVWRTLPDAIVVGDSTEPGYAFNIMAEPPAPRRWMSAATGFGTLGYALPAAIGAKIGKPDQPVIALMGDGGAHYTITELASARDADVPVILIVWNDQTYGEIEKFMVTNQIAPQGVELYPTDFAHLARAFGAGYRRVERLAGVAEALKEAAGAACSTILELPADGFYD